MMRSHIIGLRQPPTATPLSRRRYLKYVGRRHYLCLLYFLRFRLIRERATLLHFWLARAATHVDLLLL